MFQRCETTTFCSGEGEVTLDGQPTFGFEVSGAAREECGQRGFPIRRSSPGRPISTPTAIIEKNREPYFAAVSMQEKKEMTEQIVRLVGGRFLRSNQARTGWIEINGEAARVKVAQALQYRQRLLPKSETADTNVKDSPIKRKHIETARQRYMGVSTKGENGVVRRVQPHKVQTFRNRRECVGTPYLPTEQPTIPDYVSNDELRWAMETNPLHFVRRHQVLEELKSMEFEDTAIGMALDYGPEEPELEEDIPILDGDRDLTKFAHEMRRYSLLAAAMIEPLDDSRQDIAPHRSSSFGEKDPVEVPSRVVSADSTVEPASLDTFDVADEAHAAMEENRRSNEAAASCYDSLATAMFSSDHTPLNQPEEFDDDVQLSPYLHEELVTVVPQHYVQFQDEDGLADLP
jgi:hypothetical protein